VLQSRCSGILAFCRTVVRVKFTWVRRFRFAPIASQDDCESFEARVSRCGKPLRLATSASSGPTMVLSEAIRGRDHA